VNAETVVANAPFLASSNVGAGTEAVCGVPADRGNGVFYSFGGTGNVMTVSPNVVAN
jgi:hypothetical protein